MEFKLRYLFWHMLQLANKHRDPKYGDPCSHLLESIILYPDNFIKKMSDTQGPDSHEFRLNGAGLKMRWLHYKNRMYITISGDQKDLYPVFVNEAEALLKKEGFFPINTQY